MSGASLPCGVCSLRDAACGPTGRYPVDRVGAVFDSFLEMRKVARPGRFELPTLCLEGRRSIQLSYGRLTDSKRFAAPKTIICYVLTLYCARTVPEFPNSGQLLPRIRAFH